MQQSNPMDNEKYQALLQTLNIPDLDLEKLITAFTHPSYKGMVPYAEDYERFEFLGDAVINLISAEDLVKNQQLSEGAMTEKRMQLVNNEYLSQIFDLLQFYPLIRTALQYTPSNKDKANFVEALFGAIFLDKDYKECKKVWEYIQIKMESNIKITSSKTISVEEQLNIEKLKQLYKEYGLITKNAKSMLQELCQKQNLPIPEYELIGRTGLDHDPTFEVRISAQVFNREPIMVYTAIGVAKSKKSAEIKAAENLCNKIYLEYNFAE